MECLTLTQNGAITADLRINGISDAFSIICLLIESITEPIGLGVSSVENRLSNNTD